MTFAGRRVEVTFADRPPTPAQVAAFDGHTQAYSRGWAGLKAAVVGGPIELVIGLLAERLDSWGLTDDDGAMVPIDREHMRAVPEAFLRAVLDRILTAAHLAWAG